MRDALTALQLQGLIDVRPQAGSFVFMPSEEDVAELAEFRRVLETTALRLCFARRRERRLRGMRAAADAMERARDADDPLGVARADTAFHQAIAENSANEYLVAAYALVSGRVAALRTHTLMAAGTVRNRSLGEHRAVIAAFARGDLERAEAVLAQHILRMRMRFRAMHGGAARRERRVSPSQARGALLLLFDVAAAAIDEHDDWHTHEHMPERLAIPGFLRGTRWTRRAPGPRYCVLYEVAEPAVLDSPAYRARLEHPTPWTSRIMPHYVGMRTLAVRGRRGRRDRRGRRLPRRDLRPRGAVGSNARPRDGSPRCCRAWPTGAGSRRGASSATRSRPA